MLQKLEITFLELGGEEACVGGEGREIGKICFSNFTVANSKTAKT